MSSLNDSDEHTSPPATPGSRGVHVASSHFSNISAKSGNSGCLENTETSVNMTSAARVIWTRGVLGNIVKRVRVCVCARVCVCVHSACVCVCVCVR